MSDEYEFFVRRLQSLSKLPEPIEPSYARDHLLEQLRLEQQTNNLTLVLGAGVSVESLLPDWPTLVAKVTSRILSDQGAEELIDPFLASTAPEIRKIRLLESMSRGFRLYLQDTLYENYSPNVQNLQLDAISRLVERGLQSGNRQIIITYNVDDLLEKHLKKLGFGKEIRSIYSDKTYRDADGRKILIFHPHGYLPEAGLPGNELFNTPLVFSEPQYHYQYFRPNHWGNIVQLNAFMNSKCFFVGCSLCDPNHRRLLDHANEKYLSDRYHVAVIRRSNTNPCETTNRLTDYLAESDMSTLGINPLWIEVFEEIPSLLDLI